MSWTFQLPPRTSGKGVVARPRGAAIQRKPLVAAADSEGEREADAVAEAIARGGRVTPTGKPFSATGVEADATLTPAGESALHTPGTPLDADARAFLEPRFGRDLSDVRVHDDALAARSAAELSARAYTLGTHIVFGAGQYDTRSTGGRRLLAHELTHVVQQTGSPGAAGAGVVQRDMEIEDEDQRARCLAKAEEELKKLEATAAKEEFPQPDYVKDAIKVLRKKMTEGKVKCYIFSGIKHGSFKAGEIRLDGSNLDRINTTTLLHEAVHAEHAERYPKAAKKYGENEGKEVKEDDPKVRDLLRWKAYTEYWAYRSRLDYYNAQKPADQRQSDDELHKSTLETRDVIIHLQRVRTFDPGFDPRKWKPKG